MFLLGPKSRGSTAIAIVLRTAWVTIPFSIVAIVVRFRKAAGIAPYPVFLDSFAHPVLVTGIGLLALWLTWAVCRYRVSRSADGPIDAVLRTAIVGILLAAVWGALLFALQCANGMFDSGARQLLPVFVQRVQEVKFRDKNGAPMSRTIAYLNRLDHPHERLKVPWRECEIPGDGEASPFVTLQIGRGLFGYSWIDDRTCRPLQASDLPLFDGFWLGHGRPDVLIFVTDDGFNKRQEQRMSQLEATLLQCQRATNVVDLARLLNELSSQAERVLSSDAETRLRAILDPVFHSDEVARKRLVDQGLAFARSALRLQERTYTLPLWVKTIQDASPDVPIVWIHDQLTPPIWLQGVHCEKCRAVSKHLIDSEILSLFLDGGADSKPDLYLADGTGQRVFSAKLSELDRRAELTAKLAGLRGK